MLNLTYKIVGEGYEIYDRERLWITQYDYIPFPGATVAESAENHIADILKNRQKAESAQDVPPNVSELSQKVNALEDTVAELVNMIAPNETV